MSLFTIFFLFSLLIFSSVSTGLTPTEITEILQWHNSVRRNTAKGLQVCAPDTTSEGLQSNPAHRCPGGPIRELIWDDGLAQLADWVVNGMISDCTFDHSDKPGRAQKLKEFTGWDGQAGENIAMRYSTSNSFQHEWFETCRGWVEGESEFFHHGYGQATVNPGPNKIGHFTQIVDDRTEYIGCACVSLQNTCGFGSAQWCSCNFWLPGNLNGKGNPYNDIGTCEDTPAGNNCFGNSYDSASYSCDDGLCVRGTLAPTSITQEPTTPQPTGATPAPVIPDFGDLYIKYFNSFYNGVWEFQGRDNNNSPYYTHSDRTLHYNGNRWQTVTTQSYQANGPLIVYTSGYCNTDNSLDPTVCQGTDWAGANSDTNICENDYCPCPESIITNNLQLSNFQIGSFFTGLYVYQGQDYYCKPYWQQSGGRTLYYTNGWVLATGLNGGVFTRCTFTDPTDCDGSSSWTNYALSNADVSAV